MNKKDDQEFFDLAVSMVELCATGTYATLSGDFKFFIPKERCTEVRVGDVIRVYSKGIGYPIRGMDINGHEVFYNNRE